LKDLEKANNFFRPAQLLYFNQFFCLLCI